MGHPACLLVRTTCQSGLPPALGTSGLYPWSFEPTLAHQSLKSGLKAPTLLTPQSQKKPCLFFIIFYPVLSCQERGVLYFPEKSPQTPSLWLSPECNCYQTWALLDPGAQIQLQGTGTQTLPVQVAPRFSEGNFGSMMGLPTGEEVTPSPRPEKLVGVSSAPTKKSQVTTSSSSAPRSPRTL